MTTTTYTADAQERLGEFVQRAGKAFLVVRTTDVFGEPVSLKITLDDVARFYRTQANILASGVRTLAGLHGDWRPISELAGIALNWFKAVNVEVCWFSLKWKKPRFELATEKKNIGHY